MSQTQHARVKDLFLRALQVDPARRTDFVERASEGDRQLREEVATLLQHHVSATILVNETPVQPSRAERGDTITVDAAHDAEETRDAGRRQAGVELISQLPELIAETRQLLRARLTAFAVVLSVALAVALIRGSPAGYLFATAMNACAFLAMILSLGALRWIVKPSLRWLRCVELLMLGTIAGLMVVLDCWLMMTEAEQPDVAMTVSAHERNDFKLSILILVYGVFIPNSARRAAWVLLPVACLPYLTTFLASYWSAAVTGILSEIRYGTRVPMPFLAAGTSIYAAHLIHSVRLDLFRAKRFAQYRLKRLIGAGGMGVVYEAEHLLLKRPCAVKLVHPDQYLDPRALARFEVEAQATARLSHPNTIEIYDYGRTDEGIFYYVMELLPGMSLAELVERFGPLPPGRAIYLIRQVCGAIQEAHRQGLIHRDIKPANIFASQRGGVWDVAKVLDFGLVRSTFRDAPGNRTGEVVGGTPHFMAPEQALPETVADARSDIYSLGATLYFLLTGRPPREFKSLGEILLVQNAPQPAPPSQHCNLVSAQLDAVVLRCLESDPTLRFATAAELDAALTACHDHDPWSADQAGEWWSFFTLPPGGSPSRPRE